MEEQFKRILTEKDEQGSEKHVPVISIEGEKITAEVGKIEHPSLPEHFIQWISLLDSEIEIERVYLTPFAKPKVVFHVKEKPENLKVRIFCNLHGTWEGR